MSDKSEAERLHQLVLMAWAILAGIFIVVIFGVLFTMHLQLDRIERTQLINDAYQSTVSAINE